VLITHDFDDVLALADKVFVIEGGRVRRVIEIADNDASREAALEDLAPTRRRAQVRHSGQWRQ
jgi:ABC-type nitrate/sulfonate/bicarbonate transport system ATPase subunit